MSILLGLDGSRSYGAVVSAEFKDFLALVHQLADRIRSWSIGSWCQLSLRTSRLWSITVSVPHQGRRACWSYALVCWRVTDVEARV